MFMQHLVTFWGWSSFLVMCIISSKCVGGTLVWAERREKVVSTILDLFPFFLYLSSITPLSLSLPPRPPPIQGLRVGDTIVEFGSVTSSASPACKR